jgi:hypothetical protein
MLPISAVTLLFLLATFVAVDFRAIDKRVRDMRCCLVMPRQGGVIRRVQRETLYRCCLE